MAQDIVKYDSQGTEIALSPEVVRDYLVQGGGRVTDQEVRLFVELCRAHSINPFKREAYIIKYKDDQPAAIVTGKDFFTRRASEHPMCRGWNAGIIIKRQDGSLTERRGTFLAPGEILLGGYAEVYREGWETFRHSVTLSEYLRYRRDPKTGQKILQSNWRNMPATMIRKVALVQALREVFPDLFGGLYSQEEMPVEGELAEEHTRALVEAHVEAPTGEETRQVVAKLQDGRQLIYPDPHHAIGDAMLDKRPTRVLKEKLRAVAKDLQNRYTRQTGAPKSEITKITREWLKDNLGAANTEELTYGEWSDLLNFLEGLSAPPKNLVEQEVSSWEELEEALIESKEDEDDGRGEDDELEFDLEV